MTEKNRAVTIRPATALDAVNIAKLIRHSLGADQGLLRVNDQKLLSWVVDTIGTAFAAVAEHDSSGRVLGSIAMSPLQQPWSDDWFMSEAWFCVQPSIHTGDTAEKLLKEAGLFADRHRLPLFFRVPEGDEDKLALMSSRHGIKNMGTHFIRAPVIRDVSRQASALSTQ